MDLENDDLTRTEAEAVEDGTMDGEEAHRYGEFEDLRDRLERVESRLDEGFDRLMEAVESLRTRDAAAAVASGAVSTDGEVAVDADGDGDLDIVNLTPDFDGVDLTLDDLDQRDLND